VPGTYSVRLTVNGKSYTQTVTVRMDPRVKASAATLARQFSLSKGVYDDIAHTRDGLDAVRALRAELRDIRGRATGDVAAAVDSLDRSVSMLEGAGGGFGPGGGARTTTPSLSGTLGQLGQLYDALQDADVQPTTQLVAAVSAARRDVSTVVARWDALRTRAVPALNVRLRAANLPAVGGGR
jgi:hypothetical protein